MLLDIIRQAPNVSDPYHTLGLIYETMNDKKKALEFFMIAAHISPKDAPLWRRLGLMSREVGNPPTRSSTSATDLITHIHDTHKVIRSRRSIVTPKPFASTPTIAMPSGIVPSSTPSRANTTKVLSCCTDASLSSFRAVLSAHVLLTPCMCVS